jgi:hypothetical protein
LLSTLINKIDARIIFLYRQSSFLNEKSRKTLCSSLVQCYFDYSCSSWYSALSQKLKKKLQIMQNKMVRFILNLDWRAHIGQRELDSLGMLSVNNRVTHLKMNHVFKIFNGTSISYLKDNFQLFADLHNYRTRNSPYNFILPRAKGQACNTFYFTGIKDWNALPSDIKQISNPHPFKRAIKSHLSNANSDN